MCLPPQVNSQSPQVGRDMRNCAYGTNAEPQSKQEDN